MPPQGVDHLLVESVLLAVLAHREDRLGSRVLPRVHGHLRHRAHDVAKNRGAKNHHRHCEGALPVVHGEKVAISHGGHGGEDPIDRRDILLEIAVHVVAAPRRGEPGEGAVGPVAGEQARGARIRNAGNGAEPVPGTGHHMRQEAHVHEQHHQPQQQRGDFDRRLRRLHELEKLQHPRQLHQPEEPCEASELQRPQHLGPRHLRRHGLKDAVNRHGGQEVHQEVSLQVVPGNLRGHCVQQAVGIQKGSPKTEHHIQREEKVDNDIHSLDHGSWIRRIEGHGVGDSNDRVYDQSTHEEVPYDLPRVVGRYHPSLQDVLHGLRLGNDLPVLVPAFGDDPLNLLQRCLEAVVHLFKDLLRQIPRICGLAPVDHQALDPLTSLWGVPLRREDGASELLRSHPPTGLELQLCWVLPQSAIQGILTQGEDLRLVAAALKAERAQHAVPKGLHLPVDAANDLTAIIHVKHR
mmetsp:Transcript_98868/g.235762  ORF Transcript_98868/g.235762 Transcript_98868/m.235762 type:complete len:464 (-) Transcript_98868:1764-3155(-)